MQAVLIEKVKSPASSSFKRRAMSRSGSHLAFFGCSSLPLPEDANGQMQQPRKQRGFWWFHHEASLFRGKKKAALLRCEWPHGLEPMGGRGLHDLVQICSHSPLERCPEVTATSEGVEIVVLHRASIFTLTENTSYLWVPPSVV